MIVSGADDDYDFTLPSRTGFSATPAESRRRTNRSDHTVPIERGRQLRPGDSALRVQLLRADLRRRRTSAQRVHHVLNRNLPVHEQQHPEYGDPKRLRSTRSGTTCSSTLVDVHLRPSGPGPIRDRVAKRGVLPAGEPRPARLRGRPLRERADPDPVPERRQFPRAGQLRHDRDRELGRD